MRSCSKLKLGVVLVLCFFMWLLCMLQYWSDESKELFNKMNYTLSAAHRKLLRRSILSIEEPDRIWGEKCTRGDILINQGPSEPLPSGIPSFTVDIMNRCGTGCNISRIHLRCGWFSSDHLINPKVFKRVRFNDCLVNDGKPLLNGATLSFVYANTFPYSFTVSSIACS